MKIWTSWKKNSSHPVPSMYNSEIIKFSIKQIYENFESLMNDFSEDEMKENVEDSLKEILKIPEDPNSKPAENVLSLMINNFIFLDIAKELMQIQGCTKCENVSNF